MNSKKLLVDRNLGIAAILVSGYLCGSSRCRPRAKDLSVKVSTGYACSHRAGGGLRKPKLVGSDSGNDGVIFVLIDYFTYFKLFFIFFFYLFTYSFIIYREDFSRWRNE